jgi:hypothetical protein
VITMRTAEDWQVIALLLVAAGVIAARRREPRLRWAPALALAPLMALLAGYQVYQRTAYPAEYRSRNLENKIFWHNALIGFALHPLLSSVYRLTLDDTSVVQLVKSRAAASHSGDLDDVFWSSGSDGSIVRNFRAYDALCRETAWSIARTHPRAMLELFLWYKPRQLLRTLGYVSGLFAQHDLHYYGIFDQRASLLGPERRAALGAFYDPLSPVALLLMIGGAVAAGAAAMRQAFSGTMLATLGIVSAASLIPAMVTYPLIHVIVAFYVPLTLLLYGAAGWMAARIVAPR